MAEFDLIELIRRSSASRSAAGTAQRADTVLGIGDDGALIAPSGPLAVVSDTLVEGVHFFPHCPPADLGWKSLAVNLSDLAAMGASPAWALLNLCLPQASVGFINEFMAGFNALARVYALELIGGDMTRGPLCVTVTALGYAPARALTRAGARPGDIIAVSGTLGDSAWAYQALYQQQVVPTALLERLQRPEPRVHLGQSLAGVARCAIDVSDGLLADLGHILRQGALVAEQTVAHLGADLQLDQLPSSAALLATESKPEKRWPLQLAGGDDYELLVVVPVAAWAEAQQRAQHCGCPLRRIGQISTTPGIRCWRPKSRRFPQGGLFNLEQHGYRHFE